MNPTPPKHQGGSVAYFMARSARDALILEAQLADETNRNGWAAPSRDAGTAPATRTAAPAPVTPAAFVFPNVGPLGAAAFAPVTGPQTFCRDLDSLFLHEAAHACVARALGLGVHVIAFDPPDVSGNVSGRCVIGAGAENSYLMAVAAAAGPAFDALVSTGSPNGTGDHVLVGIHKADYARRRGQPYPCDPYAAAREILTRPAVTAAVNRIAARLRFGATMHANAIEQLITGA